MFEKRKQRLLNGAYVVESAILFSNRGGVYRGRTLTDRQVIIKEARPFVTIGRFSSVDAVVALRNEYQVLKALSQTGFAPEAIDYFTEWEHESFCELPRTTTTSPETILRRWLVIAFLGSASAFNVQCARSSAGIR